MPKTKKTKRKSNLSTKLNQSKPKTINREPAWKGPQEDGITQSLLSGYLVCPERFRVKTIEGLQPAEGFNHFLEFGQMWHICEECLANNEDWEDALRNYAARLCNQYRDDQQQIDKWYNVIRVTFPVYVDYWSKHTDVKDRKPLFQEESFRVPYQLPSGRTVTLRGKWDSVDMIGKGKKKPVYLQENKTKSDIDEQRIQRQLQFDLQTMLYLIALQEHLKNETDLDPLQIKGVRYNVIRRPLSGGKGSIRQKKPTKSNPQGESKTDFYNRLKDDYIAAEPDYWFMRWKSEVSQQDIEKFKTQCLEPVLENMYDDYEWWVYCHESGVDRWDCIKRRKHFGGKHTRRHYRFPFGVYNSLTDGRKSTDLDEYLDTGSTVGLERVKTLFGELEE